MPTYLATIITASGLPGLVFLKCFCGLWTSRTQVPWPPGEILLGKRERGKRLGTETEWKNMLLAPTVFSINHLPSLPSANKGKQNWECLMGGLTASRRMCKDNIVGIKTLPSLQRWGSVGLEPQTALWLSGCPMQPSLHKTFCGWWKKTFSLQEWEQRCQGHALLHGKAGYSIIYGLADLAAQKPKLLALMVGNAHNLLSTSLWRWQQVVADGLLAIFHHCHASLPLLCEP